MYESGVGRGSACGVGREAVRVTCHLHMLHLPQGTGASIVCGTEEAFLVSNVLFVVFKATECIIGLVLACQTRKIKLKGLRESSQVALASYIFAFTLIVFVVALFLTRQNPMFIVSLLVVGTLLLVSSLLILTAIFIPKVRTREESSQICLSVFSKLLCGRGLRLLLSTLPSGPLNVCFPSLEMGYGFVCVTCSV